MLQHSVDEACHMEKAGCTALMKLYWAAISAISLYDYKGGIIMSFDIFSAVTDRIILALEAGTVPWKQPWIGGSAGCISYSTGKPYSLLNHLLLGGKSGEYITYKQCVQAGGHVRRGEKSHMVVFWKPFETVDEDTGEITQHFYLRYYNVFHIDQCEGINPRWAVSVMPQLPTLKPDAAADAIVKDYVARSGVKLTITQSNEAYYSPSTDEVVVPELSQYRYVAEYYSTLFHELTHSTGHKSRLDRIADVAAFGSEAYSKEELVAELGASFLVNHTGLESPESFGNNAAYIAGWLSALKNDKRLIVAAAGAAEKAAQMILGKEDEDHVDQGGN